jgi:uncharacterized protein YyaL (SSP411 family)
LFKRWRQGEKIIGGMADDIAFLIRGLIDLYEVDFDPDWPNIFHLSHRLRRSTKKTAT